jgi:hypothetical protein
MSDFCEISGFWNFSQEWTSDFFRKSGNHLIYLGTIICPKISFLVQELGKSVPSLHPFPGLRIDILTGVD